MRQQECVGVQKDFAGLKYKYVSTEKGMSQPKFFMLKKSKNVINSLFKNYLGNILLHDHPLHSNNVYLFNLDTSFRIETLGVQ